MTVKFRATNIDKQDFSNEMVTIIADVDGEDVCSVRVKEADLTNREKMARIINALGPVAKEALS